MMGRKVNLEFVRKLELKPGCKYILIFGRGSGLTAEDIANIPRIPELTNLHFKVDDANAITAVEIAQGGYIV